MFCAESDFWPQCSPKTFSKAFLGAFWEHFWGRLGATWVALGASLAHFLSILFAGSFFIRFWGTPTPQNLGSAARGRTSGVMVKLTFPVKIVENTRENTTFRKWWLPGPLGKGELLRGYGSPGSPSPLKGIALRE